MKKCVNCGSDVGDSKFCPECGTKVEDANVPESPNPQDHVTMPEEAHTGNDAATDEALMPKTPDDAQDAQGAHVEEKKRLSKKAIIGIVVAAIVVISIIAAAGGSGDGSTGGSSSGSSGVKSAPSKSSVDFSKLNAAISAAETLDSSVYTPETWSKLETALTEGKKVADDKSSTQTQIDNATSKINTAKDALKEPFNPAKFESVPYSDVARNPDSYVGKNLVFSGKVLQVIEGTSENNLRVATNGRYDDVVFVGYDPSIMSSRILEDDQITLYGTCIGLYSYESTMGAKISIPGIYAEHITIN